MKLVPEAMPGRSNRKLVSHLGEIERLLTEGYSVASIHQALQKANIKVARSTLYVEVLKLSKTSKAPVPRVPSPPPVTQQKASTLETTTASDPPDKTSTAPKPPIFNDVDEFFRNPLNRNSFLKGRLKP